MRFIELQQPQELLERWYLVFEPLPQSMASTFGGRAVEGMGYASTAQVKRAQRRLAVLLRTLHAHLRLTPTHQLACRAQARAARGVVGGGGGAGGGAGGGGAPPMVGIRPSLNAGLLNALRADMAALMEGQAFQVRFACLRGGWAHLLLGESIVN